MKQRRLHGVIGDSPPYNQVSSFINAPVSIARTGPHDSEDLMVRKTPQLGKRISPDA